MRSPQCDLVDEAGLSTLTDSYYLVDKLHRQPPVEVREPPLCLATLASTNIEQTAAVAPTAALGRKNSRKRCFHRSPLVWRNSMADETGNSGFACVKPESPSSLVFFSPLLAQEQSRTRFERYGVARQSM